MSENPAKPKVFKIVVQNLVMTKAGWRSTSKNVIFRDGYEDFVKKYGELTTEEFK